jgi:hypothetical protein
MNVPQAPARARPSESHWATDEVRTEWVTWAVATWGTATWWESEADTRHAAEQTSVRSATETQRAKTSDVTATMATWDAC